MTCKPIKTKRADLGISAQTLAVALDVSPQAVSKWERGEALPRADLLPKLAEELHCTIDELFDHGESAE